MSKTTSPGMEIIYSEQCDCVQCQSVIPAQNIVKNILHTGSYRATQQSVKALCEHCGTLYQLTRTLRNGQWEIDAPGIIVVGDTRLVHSFRKRLELQRGDIHRTPAA